MKLHDVDNLTESIKKSLIQSINKTIETSKINITKNDQKK